MNVGAAIKRLRKTHGWDQKDLARLLNVSNRTISSWETNRTEPNMDMIEKMCELFNCSKSEFFQETVLVNTDIEVIYDGENLGKMVIEVPRDRQELFTTLNKRAQKLSEKELRRFIEIIKAFSEDDQTK